MSDHVFTFVLTGARAGKTCRLGKYQFTNGRFAVRLEGSKLGGLATYLGRVYAAFLEGSNELAERQQTEGHGCADPTTGAGSGNAAAVLGGLPDNGSSGRDAAAASVGDAGAPPAAAERGADGYGHPDTRLREAVMKLDPKDPEHWTEAGKPRLDAVVKFFGAATVTRKDVDRVAPDVINKPGG